MLVACPVCSRIYDSGSLDPGSRLRCYCGELVRITEHETRDAPAMHCASCGGALKSQSGVCDYCGAATTPAARGWGEACPRCFARMAKDAKYCSACGTEIRIEVVVRSLRSEKCPRCDDPLSLCEYTGGTLSECSQCAGIWLDESSFERLIQSTEVASFQQRLAQKREREPAWQDSATTRIRYLKCPICLQLMHRKNFGDSSGVIIDWCRGHGFWLDATELEQIYAFVRREGVKITPVAKQKLDLEAERKAARLRMRTEQRSEVFAQPGLTGALSWITDGDLFKILATIAYVLVRLLR